MLAPARARPRDGITRDEVLALTTALATVHAEPARGTLWSEQNHTCNAGTGLAVARGRMDGWLDEDRWPMVGWLDEDRWPMVGWLDEDRWPMVKIGDQWLDEDRWPMVGWLDEDRWSMVG